MTMKNRDNLRKLWKAITPYHVPYWSSYLIVCCRNFAINYLTAYLLYETTAAARQMDVPRLIHGTLLFLAILLVFIAVDALGLYVHNVTTQKITNGLRRNIQHRVLCAPLWKIESLGSSRGDILSRMNHDISMVEAVYTSSLITPLMFLISGVGAFLSIWRVSPAVALYLVILGALSLGSQYVFSKHQRKIAAALQGRISQMMVTANELFQNNLNIRLMNIYNGVQRLVGNKLLGYMKAGKSDAILQGSVGAVNGAASILQYIGVMVICLIFLDRGQMELEDITYTLQLSGVVMLAFSLLGNTLIALQRSLAAFERVDELMSIEPEDLHTGREEVEAAGSNVVTTRNASVCFTPEKHLKIETPLNIQENRITAFCGVSGGGKSSLCKTLLGFYPYDGEITFMGKPLRSYALAALRKNIAYVPQNSVIVSGTVEDNLRLGCRSSISAEELDRAVTAACCKEWIEQMPGKYAAPLAEGGMTLSGGQRQTLVLARALLQEKPVVILDETLSAVSKANAALILKNLKALYADRTILLVTHEQEIIAQCHACVELNAGSNS